MRRVKRKYIRAVEISLRREDRPDGTTVVTRTKRITNKQDWPAYNRAQTHETERFADLHSLCRAVVQPPQTKGRSRLPLADVVFGAMFKVYSAVSGRRATSYPKPQGQQRRNGVLDDQGQVRGLGTVRERQSPGQRTAL